MANRILDLSNEESQLRKKIQLENEMILDKLKDTNEEIDFNEHKVKKFLLIFHTLMETVNSEEALDNTDDSATDTILKIVLKLSEVLKNNIDSLKLPKIFKIPLKKIKSLFNLQTEGNAKRPSENEEASQTARDGGEEHRER